MRASTIPGLDLDPFPGAPNCVPSPGARPGTAENGSTGGGGRVTGGACLVTVRPQGGNHLNLESLQILIRLATASLAATLALVLVWRTLNRGRVGTVRWRVRRRHSVRVVLVLGALLISAGVVVGSQIGRSADTLLLLALSVALIALCPGFQDSVYGERGVQRGWYAR